MRILSIVLGLVVVALALWWCWIPAEVAPPPHLALGEAPAARDASSFEQAAVQRTTAVATGSMAVTRLGDGSCELKVEVTDANGEPVHGASVTWHSDSIAGPFAKLETDSRGWCTVNVSPGYLFVRAFHRDVGKSILLRLSTDDQRARVPRLALLRPAEVVGVVMDGNKKPVPDAQLIVQALLGIPYGHAAECVTSEFVQCDENGVFAFEASYGTRGTLLMAGDVNAAQSRCSFAAGLDEFVTVGPNGVARVERRKIDEKVEPKPGIFNASGGPAGETSSEDIEPSPSSSSMRQSWSDRQAWMRERQLLAQLAARRLSRGETQVFLADGSVPMRVQVGSRTLSYGRTMLEWQLPVMHGQHKGYVSGDRQWWFVADPASGQSAQVMASGRLNLGAHGSLHVGVTHNGVAARGAT